MSHASRSVHRQSRPARVGPFLRVYLAVQTKARRDGFTEIAHTGSMAVNNTHWWLAA